MAADPITTVKHELLARQLDGWAPAALRRSRRATFAQVRGGPDDGTAEAAIRVFARHTELLRGRRLTVLALAAPADDLAVRLGADQATLPPEVSVHLVTGDAERLPVALRAASASGAPILGYLDAATGPAPSLGALAAVAGGRPGEVLLVLGSQARAELDHRRVLAEAGFPLVADVELVDGVAATRPVDGGGLPQLVVFATTLGRSLDAFKNDLWAVGEGTGARYRDPQDPEAQSVDISPSPQTDPLCRELLSELVRLGPCSVTELRQFTVANTIYRASDTLRAITAMLAAGRVTRTPESGRLAGDVIIEPTTAG
ncbi:hypothetical protein GCM10027290_52360 [Micromonospora sonneratiae]|uniref:Uncharacterized protein n=1 Tax=Micromonospora sonneratiae TaxID=1184706 RepID=A0ABW3Y9E3_9ACTN